MNAEASDNFLVREETIRRLERIAFALFDSVRRPAHARDRRLDALRSSWSAHCLRCGMQLTGEELLTLAQLPADHETSRIARLRSGHCAREGCGFDRYCLVVQNHPDLDWPRLVALNDAGSQGPSPSIKVETVKARNLLPPTAQRWTAIRAGLLVILVALLWMARQCYLGGRIPLLREPEHFHVTPLGVEEKAPGK